MNSLMHRQREEKEVEASQVCFDYEILARCTYPVPVMGYPEPEADCREPAIYRVWWINPDGSDGGDMLVCQEHFDFIKATEE